MHDVLSRLPDLLACVTSSYGSILRIDSTKKVTKKLSGALIGPPTLATREETSFSVLQKEWSQMADGIMDWYEPAKSTSTDRDCCAVDGPGRYKSLFDHWPTLLVRLDIWHFMRRLAVTTKSHPLYGTFLSRLSSCIVGC